MAINSQTHRVSMREVCKEACFITPHFSIRLSCHTHLTPFSVSCSITVINSGNMAIVWFIKCQTLQSTCHCVPLLTKTQHTPAAAEDCNNRECTETRLLSVLVKLCQEGKNIFLYAANTSRHPSSVRTPLADWVVPLSGMKKLLAVAVDCEMGYHSRTFLANHRQKAFGKFMGQQTPQQEWPLGVWDRNTDERGPHAESVSKIPPVCSHLTTWSCFPLTTCHTWLPLSSCVHCKRPLIMIQKQCYDCHLIKTIPLPPLE